MKKVSDQPGVIVLKMFCEVCGVRLSEANRSEPDSNVCKACTTAHNRKEAELALRKQSQSIAGFKPLDFWKSAPRTGQPKTKKSQKLDKRSK
jgi:hypothetical protein